MYPRAGILFAFVLLGALAYGQEEPLSGEEIAQQLSKLKVWETKIADAENLPPEEEVSVLARCVRGTGVGYVYQVEEKWPLHQKAHERLIRIPGHARFLAEEIYKAYANETAEINQQPRPYPNKDRVSYGTVRWSIFETLGFIRSTETVQVLGEFLSGGEISSQIGDPRANLVGSAELPVNGVLAAKALANLIDQAPVQKDAAAYHEDEADIWELWFAQVKAGTRTFRFKGDPQDYNLQGPVSKAIEPTGLATKREDRGPMPPPSEAKPAKGFPMAALLVACVVLALAAWYAFRRKMRPA